MKSLLCTVLVSFASLVSSQAAYDVYIKFNGGGSGTRITLGDSMDSQYNKSDGWFDVSAFSFGIKRVINIGSISGGGGTEKAVFEDVVITKKAGAGSAQLFLACAAGNAFETVTIVMVQGVDTALEPRVRILQMDLHLVLVQSVKAAGSDGDETLDEVVTLKHGAQKLQFFSTTEAGAEIPAGEAQWSVITNTATTET